MSDTRLYYRHADDDTLFNRWNQQASVQPLSVAYLKGVIDNYYDDVYEALPFDNPQSALLHYLESSEVLALTQGSTLTDRIWCEYRGYVWLFAVIEASAPNDGTGNDYTFKTNCFWQGVWLDRIDKLVEGDNND